jgi:hypothetical protein
MTMKPSSYIRRRHWGDPACESSEVKVLTRAGQARLAGRSIKRTLQLREDIHACSGLAWANCGCRAPWSWAKTTSARKTSLHALAEATGVLMTARRQRTDRVNWGPSAGWRSAQGRADISIKPPGGQQRLGYGHSKRRSGGTIQPTGEPRAIGRVGEVRRTRALDECRRTTREAQTFAQVAYKPVRQAKVAMERLV